MRCLNFSRVYVVDITDDLVLSKEENKSKDSLNLPRS